MKIDPNFVWEIVASSILYARLHLFQLNPPIYLKGKPTTLTKGGLRNSGRL